jgi:succinate dehydrogenase/fumarate reductase flavoprotein subunit
MAIKVMDCDIAVIGGGGTGMICAAKAAELTDKKVIVLEKGKKLGGASIFSHFPHIYDSKWQKNAGDKISDPPEVSGQFFDWLVSKGGAEKYFKIEETQTMGTSSQKYGVSMPRRIDKYKDLDDPSIGPGWGGSFIVDKMLECCNKMNVPVLTETKAKKFVKDSNGKVTGVIAETKDGDIQVNFKACFIASGGFGANYKKCREIWPKIFNNIPMHNLNPPSLTGDVIDAAEEIGMGVDLKNAGCNVQGPVHHPYSYTVNCMALPLQVNMEGERIIRSGGMAGPMDETIQPMQYSIGDQAAIETAGENAQNRVSEPDDKERAKKWREDIAEEVAVDEKGRYGRHTTKADTLVELALKLNMDPNVLLASVEAYNKECESVQGQGAGMGGMPGGQGGGMGGMGGMMGGSQTPIKKGPFYAIFSHRFRQCTHGGIIVNEDTEVLDPKGNVMPGLYAGGDCTTVYLLETGEKSAFQRRLKAAIAYLKQGRKDGDAAPFSGPSLFGDYYVMKGGGMDGLPNGYTAAIKIAKYLGKK